MPPGAEGGGQPVDGEMGGHHGYLPLRRGVDRGAQGGGEGVGGEAGGSGGDGGDDHRVGVRVGEGGAEGLPVLGRAGAGGQGGAGERGEVLGAARVVGDQAERLGVAEHGDASAGGQGLAGEQDAGVDEFGDGPGFDHPGLPDERGGGVLGGMGGGDQVPGRQRAAAVPAAAHHDHGFAGGGRAAGEPGELARVAQRLQVHQHHVGGRVLVPELEGVVAGDVRAVPGRDEGGQSGAGALQLVQDGDGDGGGLGEDPDPAGRRQVRGGAGVEPDVLGGVQDAERSGADQPHPVGAGAAHQGALGLLGVAGREDHESLHAVLAAVGEHPVDLLGGDGEHGEVDRPGYAAQRAVRGHPGQFGGALGQRVVDGVQRSGEAAGPQPAQDLAARAAGPAAGADDGDRARGEQPLDGAGLGALLAGAHDGERGGSGFEVEGQVHGSVGEAAPLGVAGVGEHLDHLAVGGQHLGLEPADAALAGDGGDVLQQGGGQPAALVGVLDEEGDLGAVGPRRATAAGPGAGGGPAVLVDAVVADGGQEVVADGGGEADPVVVVVVGEAVHVLVGQPGVGGEEAVVLRLVRDPLVEADQPPGVVGGDRPDPCRAAVPQHHVGLPVGGIDRLFGCRHGFSVRLRAAVRDAERLRACWNHA